MQWLVFEDKRSEDLAPLTLLRPAFELICGREGLRRRLQRWFPTARWGAVVRDYLKDVYTEEHPDAVVNDIAFAADQPTLVVNGRWLPESRVTEEDLQFDRAGFVGEEVAWMLLHPDEIRMLSSLDLPSVLNALAQQRRRLEATGTLMQRPWDLIRLNGTQLERDFADEGVSQTIMSPHVQILGDAADVYLSPQAEIDPYVVIDARSGPVSVDRDVKVQSFTRIEGPCHISRGCSIFRAHLRSGTTIGEHCKVGGEVEESILHACVNKYHEGFLGHSYICPWVNLGAISTTSDLKSDYSTVRVPVSGELVDSGLCKVGSFIADHTKTAIDSMFNTGSSVGVMAMVLPGGRLLPRHIPSFCNIHFGELAEDWPLEQSLQTARIAMSRRGCELTATMEQLIRTLHRRTQPERDAAIRRAVARRV
ncbi:MAG: hypothetical protein KDA89_07740 [Planctomycetaceae bacterium]|nr:hypothetical protein [Planctomycetaceae bacterium]